MQISLICSYGGSICLLREAVRCSILGLGLCRPHLSRLPSSPLVTQDVWAPRLRGDERVNTPTQKVRCVLRFYCTQTCCSTGEAPPTPSNMVPVSSRVLKDKLISVPTLSNKPLSSTYPGLEKLTVCRFCKRQRKKLDVVFQTTSIGWKN